jgi:20S proteasome alpha/beta subunit
MIGPFPKPHPFPKPKPQRLPRRKHVTIGAAFPCKEGLIIGADTQEDIGSIIKGNTEKMHVLSMGEYTAVVTGAGDGDLIRATVDEMKFALEHRQPQTISEIESVFRLRLLQGFRDHIIPYAAFPNDDRPSMELLIGLHVKANPQDPTLFETRLYAASGTTFRRSQKAECIGSGIILAKSLIDQYFDIDLSMRHASLLALYILRQAKKWAQFCGGNSDVLLLSNQEAEIKRIPTDQVKSLERHFDEFSEHLKPVLIACADIDYDPTALKVLLQDFASNMHQLQGKMVADFIVPDLAYGAFLRGWSGKGRRKKAQPKPLASGTSKRGQ